MLINRGSSYGSQPKERIGQYWFKYDLYNHFEGCAETLMSRFIHAYRPEKWLHFAEYSPIVAKHSTLVSNNTLGCKSRDFNPDNNRVTSLTHFLTQTTMLSNPFVKYEHPDVRVSYKMLMQDLTWLFDENTAKYFTYQALFDAIGINLDRHVNNIGVIIASPVLQTPLYDFGASLGAWYPSDVQDINFLLGDIPRSCKFITMNFDNAFRIAYDAAPIPLNNHTVTINIKDLLEIYSQSVVNRACALLQIRAKSLLNMQVAFER